MGFVGTVGPYLLRALKPGHDPRQEPDPQWITDWIAGHAATAPADPPLLDTAHPDIPVPFPMPAAATAAAAAFVRADRTAA